MRVLYMKKIVVIFFVLIFIYSLFSQEKLKEEVNVINEILVIRVYDKAGNQIKDLKQKDILIYQNGEICKIDSCSRIVNKIKSEKIDVEAVRKKEFKPRVFVLTFKIMNFSDKLKNGLNYLFNNVLRKKDHLIILTNTQYLDFKEIFNKDKIFKSLINILKRESKLMKFNYIKLIQKINSLKLMINKDLNESRKYGDNRIVVSDRLVAYLEEYLSYIKFYKKKYIIPDIDSFYYFAKYLEKINLKKWVLNFVETSKFPVLKEVKRLMNYQGMIVGHFTGLAIRKAEEIYRELNVPDSIPSEEISKLFIGINAIFHVFLINENIKFNEEEYKHERMINDFEMALKEITKNTGGEVVFSNRILDSIQKIEIEEDVSYLIGFVPRFKSGRIKVRIKNKNYKVKVYKREFNELFKDYLKKKTDKMYDVIVNDTKNNTLSFKIIKNDTLVGVLEISMDLFSINGKNVYSKSKDFKINEKIINFNIKFKGIKEGEYYYQISVFDINNGKRIVKTGKIYLK